MFLFDYKSDLGLVLPRIKAFISGFNTVDNQSISQENSLLIVSRIVDVDDFKSMQNKEAVCSLNWIRQRRLIYTDEQYLIELTYPKPFLDIDWQIVKQEKVRLQTIGERLNDSNIRLPIVGIF